MTTTNTTSTFPKTNMNRTDRNITILCVLLVIIFVAVNVLGYMNTRNI